MKDKDRVESYRHFYEEVGEKYPEEDIVYKTLKGRIRRAFVISHLDAWQGRLLDVGCNRGTYLKAYSGGEKVGVDLSWPVLRKMRDSGDQIPLVVADAQALDCFREDVFDIALCSEVLEHVLHPEKLIAGLHRVLVPGGRALITVPNYKGNRPEWAEVGTMEAFGVHGVSGDRYYHTAFRPEELAAMGEDAGFKSVESGTLEKEIKYASKVPLVFFYLLNLLNRLTFRNHRWYLVNQQIYDGLMLGIYHLVKSIGLNRLFVGLISEGVRSYAILEKPER